MSAEELPDVILFDLDDTIIAQTRGAEKLWDELCERYASRIEGIDAQDLLSAIDEAKTWFWDDLERHRTGRLDLKKSRRNILAMAFEKLGIDNPELSIEIADTFTKEREERSFLFQGAVKTLEKLCSQGKKLGMVTNGASDMQRNKIERFKLEPFFHCITIEGEFGRGKPDKDVFEHTLKRLGVSAKDACMVGDDLGRDIAGAHEAGIYTIWVNWRNQPLPEDSKVIPDRIITSITELL